MRTNTYLTTSLSVIIISCLINPIAAQNQAKELYFNATQSAQKQEIDHVIKCRVSFKINHPSSVASLYFNFDHSTLEAVSIEIISNDLNIAEGLSNRSSLEVINKTGFIDMVLYQPTSLPLFPQGQSKDILEITFKSKISTPNLTTVISLNTEFPRKTSLAYNGLETNENYLEKSLEIIDADGHVIEKRGSQSLSSARPKKEDVAVFNIQLTFLKSEEQLTLVPSEILSDTKLALNNMKSLPNPFASSTTVFYQLAQESTVQIEVMNQYGLLIKRLPLGRRATGSHQAILSGQELPAGVYFCRLLADSKPLKTLKLIKL